MAQRLLIENVQPVPAQCFAWTHPTPMAKSTRASVVSDARNRTEQRKYVDSCRKVESIISSLIRQRAYRERKVNHTIELEGRISYLEIHIEELKVENKQLEANISQTRVENGVLRNKLHASRQSVSTPKSSVPPVPPPTHVISNAQVQAKPVLVKDLLMLYGPHADDDYR